MVRKPGKKSIKKIWIFCEGDTEKQYFKKMQFHERISRLTIRPLKAKYNNADSMVREAIEFMKNNEFIEGDIIACVFDRDNNSEKQLIASRKSEKNKILLAFSNPCFEYWVLCHFGYFEGPYETVELQKRILDYIPTFKKSHNSLYPETKCYLPEAIKNAKKIKERQVKRNKDLISRETNPITLVSDLITTIEQFKD